MNRFTTKQPDGTYCIYNINTVTQTTCFDENNKNAFTVYDGDAINKLGHYEDLEEQGFILKASCKIGDTVFVIQGSKYHVFEVIECKVSKISALSSGKGASITCSGRYRNGNYYKGNFRISSFGKKVFKSREEAEKYLIRYSNYE